MKVRPRKRPQIKVVAHYMLIDGKEVEIDPFKTDLPDRCKLVLAEIATGRQLKLVEARGS
ncbi:hypothetical protein FOI68_20470 [Brevibacillus sp. LEMMJ03]|uniref:hypothetical protein n=1 Tax=Brevibacillus TaxID=55080 RepID=UPI0005531CF9|nr:MULTISPECIES: hypothetical protein [Brevibacillus]MCG6197242.1 hypothetical protein [Anoxybacillus sp. LAT_38]TRY23646.1 hypothetical protein FOI68_20470 [Brevibacillus sp. LEMMJ03]